jgi:3',5'-cyclic AMP phosphodiesterase CpdA
LNWKWGSGHLVLLGDVVDRGEQVTECLWLIYKLEQQARKQDGYVHFLLGNHEIMIMTEDHRYLADKYFYMNDQLKIDFSDHYDQNSFFRKWLSSKNAILKLGPYLFLHGGLSYDSFFLKYSISEMNSVIRQYLKNPKSKSFTDTIKWVLSDNGPLWYRGYNAQFDSTKLISSSQLDSVLKLYQARTIFIGHTHTSEIKSVFNGRVILMDVPYYLDEAEPEAIKIDSMKIYRLKASKFTELEIKQ